MWIVTALLILVAWTAVGFVTAVLFFRLGFGFEVRTEGAEAASEAPSSQLAAPPIADRRWALAHADASAG